MTQTREPRHRGVFPVVPTTFTATGELDLASQKRCVDFMIDAGSQGVCILANFSEQFALSDDERELLTRAILEHVAGRIPVIVTTTHFGSRVCAQRSRRAQDMGAAMVMAMPPYHGATIRVSEQQVFEFFAAVSDAIDIPIMIQDAPVSGTALPAAFLARMAREIEHVAYFKIETAGAASKLRELLRLGGDAIEGPWDGEEGITLEDYVTWQKSVLLDMAYLQQDAFDEVDACMPRERQLDSLRLIMGLIDRDYGFKDRDAAREFFTKVIGLYKNWNYSPPGSPEYQKYRREIEESASRGCHL